MPELYDSHYLHNKFYQKYGKVLSCEKYHYYTKAVRYMENIIGIT